MATYVLLLTLTPEGREEMLDDPDRLLRAEEETDVEGVHCLGIYGVLGAYDFVTMLEAPDNEAAARFSLELGVAAGVHVETLPAVPIALFDSGSRERERLAEAGAERDLPDPLPEEPPA